LRSDGASGVEVAIVAEEFGRRLVDTPFLGPVLADDLARHIGDDASGATVVVDGRVIDARGARRALSLSGGAVSAVEVQALTDGVDLTRADAKNVGSPVTLGEVSAEVAEQWRALALVTTAADLVGVARGAHAVACDYAKIREQYGKQIGSYQAIAHLLAESLALIEGSISMLRHAAWAVDELAPAEIETVLHGHPAVKDCAVFGIPDGLNGEASVAAVAAAEPVDATQLTALVDEKLASYKHLSRVVFVPEIPRLPSGKVLRRVLKERYGCTSDN
jgi:hypothetical protein